MANIKKLDSMEPDFDLEKYLTRDAFRIHGVIFNHYDILQSLIYMSKFCFDSCTRRSRVDSNSMLITVDSRQEAVLCSAGKYNPREGEPDQANSVIVHGSKISFFLTNGFIVDNFELLEPQGDYITDDGEVLLTRHDMESHTELKF